MLKYVRMKMEDLLTVYKTFIKCIVEYCCVVWHSSLTVHQNNSLERIQRVRLNIILGKDYVEYIIALESCELEIHWSQEGTSFPSILQRNASSSLPCCSSPTWTPTTPLGAVSCPCQSCQAKKKYRKSALPYIQRLLNQYFICIIIVNDDHYLILSQ